MRPRNTNQLTMTEIDSALGHLYSLIRSPGKEKTPNLCKRTAVPPSHPACNNPGTNGL